MRPKDLNGFCNRKLADMMSPLSCILLCVVFASALAGASLTGCTSLVKTIDHRQDQWENADLWRRVKDHPVVFVPRAFGSKEELSRNKGDWIVNAQDQAAFFRQATPGWWPGSLRSLS